MHWGQAFEKKQEVPSTVRWRHIHRIWHFGLNVVFVKVVHTCGGGSKVVNKYSFIKYSALCSNGTIYSQEMGVSSWEVKLSWIYFCLLVVGK